MYSYAYNVYRDVLTTLSFINLRNKTVFENSVTYTDLIDRSSIIVDYFHKFEDCSMIRWRVFHATVPLKCFWLPELNI